MNGRLLNLHLRKKISGIFGVRGNDASDVWVHFTCRGVGERMCFSQRLTQSDRFVNAGPLQRDGLSSGAAVEPPPLSQCEWTEGGDKSLMRWLNYTVRCPVLSCSPVTSLHDSGALVYQPLTLDVH